VKEEKNLLKILAGLALLFFSGSVLAGPPPSITTTLGPTPLYEGNDARCTVYFEDEDSDQGRIEVNWSVSANEVDIRYFDNVENDSTITSNLDSSYYNVGQQVLCNATAYDKDGDGDSTWAADNIIVQTDPPNVTDGPHFFNYSSSHAFNVSAIVRDREGQDDMSWCRINVTDGDGNQLLENMTMIKSYGDDTEARCFYQNVSNYTAGFGVLEDLEVMVWVNDSRDDSGNKTDFNTIPNSPPVIYNVYPKDDSNTASSDIELEANVMDQDGELMNVSFYNNSGASPQRLHFDENIVTGGYTSDTWNDLQSLKTFKWYVNATDGHQTIIEDLRFRNLISSQFRVQTGFDYRYSTVITSVDTSNTVPFTVRNTADSLKQVSLDVNGANAVFQSEGSDQKDLNLNEGQTERLMIDISPESVGGKTLEVVTTNDNFELSKTDRMDVYVRNPSATAAAVPGIGLLQLFFLMLAASTLYCSGRL
jgi:hypothetical protein